jgi:hypothetical protein
MIGNSAADASNIGFTNYLRNQINDWKQGESENHMNNPIDFYLDVLAASPEEINQVEVALQQTCDELLCWAAGRVSKRPEDIAADVKEIVSFKPVRNLGYIDPSVNKARRFTNFFTDRFWGTVMTHVLFVSKQFPTAILLLEYWDPMASYAGKMVIRAGEEVHHVCDSKQQSQSCEWVLPNIFAPFLTEYWNGEDFGCLWDQWVSELVGAVQQLQAMSSATQAGVALAGETLEAPNLESNQSSLTEANTASKPDEQQ